MKRGPLKIPVMDNLDNLTYSELSFYYDYWLEKFLVKPDEPNTLEKFTKVSREVRRRLDFIAEEQDGNYIMEKKEAFDFYDQIGHYGAEHYPVYLVPMRGIDDDDIAQAVALIVRPNGVPLNRLTDPVDIKVDGSGLVVAEELKKLYTENNYAFTPYF